MQEIFIVPFIVLGFYGIEGFSTNLDKLFYFKTAILSILFLIINNSSEHYGKIDECLMVDKRTEFDLSEWKRFIHDQKTGSWINVAAINHDDEGNPVASSDWRDKYDIYSTPVVYLLDKQKKIIAKRITHQQIVEIISRLNGN